VNATPFPATPKDVVALSVQEFRFGLDLHDAPSLDVICARFVNDTNRAVVWWIRFRALKALCARAEIVEWLNAGSGSSSDVCEVAATCELNDDWEFDAGDFCSAVHIIMSERLRRA
jgi:hypothetical protein